MKQSHLESQEEQCAFARPGWATPISSLQITARFVRLTRNTCIHLRRREERASVGLDNLAPQFTQDLRNGLNCAFFCELTVDFNVAELIF